MYLHGPRLQSFRSEQPQTLGEWYDPGTWGGGSGWFSSSPKTEELTVTPKGWKPVIEEMTVTPQGWAQPYPGAPNVSKSTGGFFENFLPFLANTATKILAPSQPQQPQVGAPMPPGSVAAYTPQVAYTIQTPQIGSLLSDPKVLLIGGGLLLMILLMGDGGGSSSPASPTINIRAPSSGGGRRRRR